ncbi:MAG: redoxin family protein [Armatimonadetes bacterium]|nr:redoxin family protein [Armatimonadota bacterium]MBX3110127.1 redoxin family protein [Fimbriimonadaceae bacterium]
MLAAVLSAIAVAAPPEINLVDGRVIQLSGRPATVVVFISHDCPIANDSQPALERAYQRFKSKAVAFVGVYIDPRLKARGAAAHKKEYGFSYDQSVDTRHALVGYLKATVTPEAFVLDRSGKVCYRGRINDMYNDLGSRKAKVTTNDLEDAIAAVVAGKAPKTARTKAHGCVIPELKDFAGL